MRPQLGFCLQQLTQGWLHPPCTAPAITSSKGHFTLDLRPTCQQDTHAAAASMLLSSAAVLMTFHANNRSIAEAMNHD
jgi:hypothetical protein